MKKESFLTALTVGLAVTYGCSEKEAPIVGIKIKPTIETRVTGLHFDPGDRIGLTITKEGETYVRNHAMSYDGAAFTGSGLLWYNDLNEKSTLTAYYPYTEAGEPTEFTIASDQTAGGDASDLLGAVRKDVAPASTAVGMVFYHLMSQLMIIVANDSDAAVAGVTVSGFIPTAAVDFAELAVTAKTGVAASQVEAFEVTPNVSYRVILVPQRGALTVTVTTRDGKSHSKTLPSAALESGKRYNVSVLVTNIDIELTLSGDIDDWDEGGSLDDDTNPDISDLEYDGARYRTEKIGERVWMAENLRYQPIGAVIGAGVWYPESGLSSVPAKGLLYNYTTAMSSDSPRAGASSRGICPEGWHIPTVDELEMLVNAEPKPGFFTCAGYWIVNGTNNRYGSADKGFLISSESADGRIGCLSYTTTSGPKLETVPIEYGVSLRCVKDVREQ